MNASWFLTAVAVYLAFGFFFALFFVTRGAQRIDPQAEGGSWGFRLAILPGSTVLWPFLMRRWLRRLPPPEETNSHRKLARIGGGR